MSEKGCGENLGWFVAGLVIGGVIGVLFAPYSGEETRHKIVDVSKKAKDEIIKKADDLKKTISETFKSEEDLVLEEEK